MANQKEQWLDPSGLDLMLAELRTKLDELYAPIGSIDPNVNAEDITNRAVELAQIYADEKIKALHYLNENLLDNWYFGLSDIVDQRQGYIVLPNTPYVDVWDGRAAIGVTDNYYTATIIDDDKSSFVMNEITYYTNTSNIIKGYINCNGINGFDRWGLNSSNVYMIFDTGLQWIQLTDIGYAAGIQQFVYRDIFNKVLTFSMLTSDNIFKTFTFEYNTLTDNWDISKSIQLDETNTMWFGIRKNGQSYTFVLTGRDTSVHPILAIKLEEGPNQTLVYEKDGKYILRNIPNYLSQLEICQRYQVLGLCIAHTYCKSGNVYWAFCPLPVTMRCTPILIGTPDVYKESDNTKVDNVVVTIAGELWNNGVVLKVSGISEPCYIIFRKSMGFDAN